MAGGMSNPDWAKIEPPKEWSGRGYDPMGRHNVPSGDPTRWGYRVSQHFHSDSESFTGVLESDQLIRTQTQDVYPRPWMLVGSIIATNEMWALDAATWKAYLEITQGAGQAQFRHFVDLRALVTLAAPFYVPVPEGDRFGRPFFINPGAVIGSNVFVRVIQALVASAVVDSTIDTAVVTTPIAAGWGL
jgi:hypothetical protein